MILKDLDEEKLKLILKTSEGFPTQYGPSQARIVDGLISPSRSGHSLGRHIRGAQRTLGKTKFCSLDDMAKALAQVLKTPEGILALQQLQPDNRSTFRSYIKTGFPVEGEVDLNPPQKITFTRLDLETAGFNRTRCFVILEGRSRGSEAYLHVQTFYPEFNPDEITRLLDAKTRYWR